MSTVNQLAETLRYRRIAQAFDVSPETLAAFDAAVAADAERVKLRVMAVWAQISRADEKEN
jgi:hypothetical protein